MAKLKRLLKDLEKGNDLFWDNIESGCGHWPDEGVFTCPLCGNEYGIHCSECTERHTCNKKDIELKENLDVCFRALLAKHTYGECGECDRLKDEIKRLEDEIKQLKDDNEKKDKNLENIRSLLKQK